MYIANTLFPIIAIILIGAGLARWRFLKAPFIKDLNHLIYWVGLPCLIIHSLEKAGDVLIRASWIFLAFTVVTLLCLGIAFFVARMISLEKSAYGTFLQASFRGNLALVGLPILYFLMEQTDPGAAQGVLATASLVLAPSVILYNVLSVIVLLQGQGSDDQNFFLQSVKNIASNPLIIAAIIGIVLSLSPIPLPAGVIQTLKLLGQISIPLALLGIGGSLITADFKGNRLPCVCTSFLKVAVTPCLAYWVGSHLFSLEGNDLRILVIFGATPTAAASFVLAQKMGGSTALASGSIALSTLLSSVSIACILWLI